MKNYVIIILTIVSLNFVNAKEKVNYEKFNLIELEIKDENNKTLTLNEDKLLEIENIKLNQDIIASSTCCTQTAYSGDPKSDSWVYVRITKCVEGNGAVAYHSACAWALAGARQALAIISSYAAPNAIVE